MEREAIERAIRPIGAGIVVLLTLLLLLGTAIRDPRPHDIPIAVAGPQPVVDQLSTGLAANAPGVFAVTTQATEADARSAVDRRDAVAAVLVAPAGVTLVVAGAAGDATSGVVTGALSPAFAAQGITSRVEVVHPFGAGDPHGIVLFFLVLATLIASAIAGALTGLATPGRSWATRTAILIAWAVTAGVVGTLTAAWLSDGFISGIWTAMAVVGLFALAIAATIAGAARLLGPVGVGLAVLTVVVLGIISSGGPLGSAFLPDAYRTLAPWLPVEPAYAALRGALFFDGAGLGTPLAVLAVWSVIGLACLAAPTLVGTTSPRRVTVAA